MPGSSLFLVYVNGCLQTTESITTLMIDSKDVHCASLAPRKPWITSCVARLLWRNKFISNKSPNQASLIGISLIVHCHLFPAVTDSGGYGHLPHVRTLPLKIFLPPAWTSSQTHSGRLINLNLLSLLVAFSRAYRKYWTTACYPLSPTSCLAKTS